MMVSGKFLYIWVSLERFFLHELFSNFGILKTYYNDNDQC